MVFTFQDSVNVSKSRICYLGLSVGLFFDSCTLGQEDYNTACSSVCVCVCVCLGQRGLQRKGGGGYRWLSTTPLLPLRTKLKVPSTKQG